MQDPSASACAPPPDWLLDGRVIGGGDRLGYQLGPCLHNSESAWLHALRDEFGRSLVLKLLRPHATQGEAAEAKWQRELRLLSRLHHPGVVRLHDAFPIDQHYAFVLERADLSLTDWINRSGPMPEAHVRHLAFQLLDALAAIHRARVIHLDLSPANVLLRLAEATPAQTLITDFGIGVCMDDEEELRRPSADWALIPPELLRPGQHRATPRCDLYALGHTLLFALRGSLPLSRVTAHDEVERQVWDGVFHKLALQLGTPFGAILARLLEVDPELRYPSALEAWRDLRALG